MVLYLISAYQFVQNNDCGETSAPSDTCGLDFSKFNLQHLCLNVIS